VQQAVTTDKDFCLDSSLHLKHKHRYYTQIQLQMFLTKCQYCDFVVYTKQSMVIVRVPIDFCKHLVTKCEQFIKDYLIVELVTRRWPLHLQKKKKMKIVPEYGRMIKCVNIRRKPKGKWYCVSCDE
jgi:hypothetical protein